MYAAVLIPTNAPQSKKSVAYDSFGTVSPSHSIACTGLLLAQMTFVNNLTLKLGRHLADMSKFNKKQKFISILFIHSNRYFIQLKRN